MVEKIPGFRSKTREIAPVEEQRERHEVNKGYVEVHHKLFVPRTENQTTPQKNSVNVFLTGWSVPEHTRSLENYGQNWADITGKDTYIIDTPFHNINGNTLAYEAEAIRNFLQKKRVNKLSLSGHSRGATKAMDVAHQLQENTDTEVEGLTLINSVGLYEQSLLYRTKGFVNDVLRTHLHLYMHLNDQNGKDNFNNATNIFVNSLLNQAHDARKERLHFLPKVLDELKPTGEINPHTHELQCPIVILTGSKDPLSHPEQIIPNKNRKRKEKAWLPYEERESYLKETLFSSSPSVKMLVAERNPHHIGIVLRPKTYARVQEALHTRMKELQPENKKKLTKSKEKAVFSVTA